MGRAWPPRRLSLRWPADERNSLGTRLDVITALVGWVSAAHPNHKRIAAGAALIGVLTMVAKLFVAAREMAIAWRYGVSATVDSYQLALTATTWLPMMLTGVMAVVLVPRLVKLRRQGGERERFIAELNASVLVLGVGGCGPDVARGAGSGGTSGFRYECADAPSYCRHDARRWRRRRFSIISRVICSPVSSRGSDTVTASPKRARAGYRAVRRRSDWFGRRLGARRRHSRGLLAPAPRSWCPRRSWVIRRWAPCAYATDRPSGARSTAVLLMVAGQFLITASIPIDQGFAARLGEGAVASLGYANRIITLFSGLATIVVGRALLPVLSGAVADGDLALGRRHALQWSALLFGASAIGAAILWAASPEIVRLLFQRGAFTAAASAEVSRIVRWGLLQLPFYFAGIALVQWYAATGRFGDFLDLTRVRSS